MPPDAAGRRRFRRGSPRHPAFHFQFLSQDRGITVYLPPGYDEHSPQRYPVLYLHDGQNLFGDSVSSYSGKGWEADRTAQALIARGRIRPLIIVGIDNSGERRIDEYTPSNRLAVMSPSVWWDDKRILKDIAAAPSRTPARIWVDIGTDEGDNPEAHVAHARMLRDALIAKGWKLNDDLAYFEDPGAKHSEGPWAKRFGPLLEFLYKN